MTPPKTGRLADPDRLLYPPIHPHYRGSPSAAMTSLRSTRHVPKLSGHVAATNLTASFGRLQPRGTHKATT
jgi:hypothetical protein